MTAPTPPSIDLPRWAYSGGVSVEPDESKREIGWVEVLGQNYGEIPPYQWVNWLSFSAGEWLNYLCGPITSTTGIIPYLQAGNFDSGINILNDGILKFYETTPGSNYISFKSPTTLTETTNYILPALAPRYDNQVLGSSSGVSNVLSWQFGSGGNPNPDTTTYPFGVPPGFIGEQISAISTGTVGFPGPNWFTYITYVLPAGIWDISAMGVFFSATSSSSNITLDLYLSKSSTQADYFLGSNAATWDFIGASSTSYINTLTIPKFRVCQSSSGVRIYLYVRIHGSNTLSAMQLRGGSIIATRVG